MLKHTVDALQFWFRLASRALGGRYEQLHRRLLYANLSNVQLRKCKSVPFDLYSWDSKVEFWNFLLRLYCGIFSSNVFKINCVYPLFNYFPAYSIKEEKNKTPATWTSIHYNLFGLHLQSLLKIDADITKKRSQVCWYWQGM